MLNFRKKKAIQRVLLIGLLTVSLTVPTSAFASTETYNHNEKSSPSFITQFLNRIFSKKSNDEAFYATNSFSDHHSKKDHDEEDDHTDRDYWGDNNDWEDKDDWREFDKKEWEKWFKKNAPLEESDKIWEKWYCDWGDKKGDH